MPSFDEAGVNLGDYEDHVEDEYGEEPLSEEALKLLSYRQKLKERLRLKLRQESGNSLNAAQDMRAKPALQNFGSFFGPSKPSIADRVIRESKALLETPLMAPKAFRTYANKVSISCTGPDNVMSSQPSPDQVKRKAQILKDTRDYSFLFSDEAEIPKPKKDPMQQNNVVPKPASPISSDSQRQLDFGNRHQPSKKSSSINGSGPVRPAMPKALPPQKPISFSGEKGSDSSIERKPPVGTVGDRVPLAPKSATFNGQRPLIKSQTSCVYNKSEHRRDMSHQSENIVLNKENAGASKFQNKLPKRSAVEANQEMSLMKKQKLDRLSVHKNSVSFNNYHLKKKQRDEETLSDDDCDYRSIIRNMFGYRPSRYEDVDEDDDDMCMEAGFDTIQEEELRSAKIAKREDEEELAKILEEERQERLRKKAKLRKMSR